MFKALAIAAALLLPMSANADQNPRPNPGVPYSDQPGSIFPAPGDTVVIILGREELTDIDEMFKGNYLGDIYEVKYNNPARYGEIVLLEAARNARIVCTTRLGYPNINTPEGTEIFQSIKPHLRSTTANGSNLLFLFDCEK